MGVGDQPEGVERESQALCRRLGSNGLEQAVTWLRRANLEEYDPAIQNLMIADLAHKSALAGLSLSVERELVLEAARKRLAPFGRDRLGKTLTSAPPRARGNWEPTRAGAQRERPDLRSAPSSLRIIAFGSVAALAAFLVSRTLSLSLGQSASVAAVIALLTMFWVYRLRPERDYIRLVQVLVSSIGLSWGFRGSVEAFVEDRFALSVEQADATLPSLVVVLVVLILVVADMIVRLRGRDCN